MTEARKRDPILAVRLWFRSSMAELNQVDLTTYGIVLCLLHVVTFMLWVPKFYRSSYFNVSKGFGGGICWSFAPFCQGIQLTVRETSLIGTFYFVLALVAAGAFLCRRLRLAWWLLLTLTVVKLAIQFLDYRSMGNYHYMTTIVTLLYLFVPGRRSICQTAIVLMYVSSGLLKFNSEWLSGAALHANVSGFLIEWMCAYVVLLETCLAFGLLSSLRWLRWATLSQIAVFHAYSFLFVGYYFPLVMGLLLSLFPLTWLSADFKSIRFTKIHAALIALFILAQLIPQMQAGDPALVGRGRLYSLNMFDSTPTCYAQFFVRFDNEQYEAKVPSRSLSTRIKCDPLIAWNFGRTLCSDNRSRPRFKEIDFLMTAKRETDPEFTKIAAVENFCERATTYNTLMRNEWESP